MKVIRHQFVAEFRQKVDSFLLEDEITHNVILGITSRILHQGDKFDDIFVAHVEDEQGEIVAVMMRTVPFNPILSNIKNTDAIPLFVDALAEVYDTLPGVIGTPDECLKFATLWQEKMGQSFHIAMEQGIYRLETLIPPQNISGSGRQATLDDLDLLVDWAVAFANETGGNSHTFQDLKKSVLHKLENPIMGGFALWMDDGQPVSMASVTRESTNSGNVSYVFTPPEFRKHGYASAVTAYVTQNILSAGKKYASLYTDLSYATSNKIYQAIGYEHINNHRLIVFDQEVKKGE